MALLSDDGVTSGIVIHHYIPGGELAIMLNLDSAAELAALIQNCVVDELTVASRAGEYDGP